MILFLIGWKSDERARDNDNTQIFEAYLTQIRFFEDVPTKKWTSPSGSLVAVWAAHAPARLGGIEYTHEEPERFALFAGRPYSWLSNDNADGRTPLSAGHYLGEPRVWAENLDGRFCALRYDDHSVSLDVCTDPMGAYPLYACETPFSTWISNAPGLLRRILGDPPLNMEVVAAHVAGGWSLDGSPWWQGITRLPRGTVTSFSKETGKQTRHLLPEKEIAVMYGRGADPEHAARQLVAAVRALADWPRRPSIVPVTGGKDSRLILAAAVAARLDCTFVTGGALDRPDVVIAKQLCATLGLEHHVVPSYAYWSVSDDHTRMAQLLQQLSGGTASTADGAGFPIGPINEDLVLWHSGQGGEIARCYFGEGPWTKRQIVPQLCTLFMRDRQLGAQVLNTDGQRLIRAQIAAWIEKMLAADASTGDLPDLFYLLNRMPYWAAPTHACVEFVRDTTSPLWSARLLPHMIGLSRSERIGERFHYRVVQALAPELLDIQFEKKGWPTSYAVVRKRMRRVIAPLRELRLARLRRTNAQTSGPRSRTSSVAAHDSFSAVLTTVRQLTSSSATHPAWEVLNRPGVEGLLQQPPETLNGLHRSYVWRLLDTFAPQSF